MSIDWSNLDKRPCGHIDLSASPAESKSDSPTIAIAAVMPAAVTIEGTALGGILPSNLRGGCD